MTMTAADPPSGARPRPSGGRGVVRCLERGQAYGARRGALVTMCRAGAQASTAAPVVDTRTLSAPSYGPSRHFGCTHDQAAPGRRRRRASVTPCVELIRPGPPVGSDGAGRGLLCAPLCSTPALLGRLPPRSAQPPRGTLSFSGTPGASRRAAGGRSAPVPTTSRRRMPGWTPRPTPLASPRSAATGRSARSTTRAVWDTAPTHGSSPPVDNLDPNMVLGLFTYDSRPRVQPPRDRHRGVALGQRVGSDQCPVRRPALRHPRQPATGSCRSSLPTTLSFTWRATGRGGGRGGRGL